jgi:3,4-dihydroxy 2-butanone 4-phosphate synthase/GTP cyclohydrolase II
VRVVLDPRARVPEDSRVLTDGAAPTLWLVGPSATVPDGLAEQVTVVRLPADDTADPGWVVAELTRRGLGRVLVEGGGKVVSSFLQAGVLDRLLLTSAPVLIGDGVPGLRFAGSDSLAEALRGPTRRFAMGQDVCTEVDLRADPATGRR